MIAIDEPTGQPLSAEQLEKLHRVLSRERMATYIVAAGHDEQRAARLYLWNGQVGEAFHLPIQAVEVGLRNAINEAFTASFGVQWWSAPAFTAVADGERKSDLEQCRRRIVNRGLSMCNGQVVAGLSFGFWVGMLQKRYNPTVWAGHAKFAFTNLPQGRARQSIEQETRHILTLRNRIWHREPIFKRNLSDDHRRVMQLLGWLCPTKLSWIRPHCRVPALLRLKP